MGVNEANDECPYKLAGICMNSVSVYYDEYCSPGTCAIYKRIVKAQPVRKAV